VLATAANEKLAHAVAEHLGLFDAVMASDATTNLSARRKLDRILLDCGEGGYDYYGNSADDVCLLDAAGEATVVQPDSAARRWQSRRGSRLIEDDGSLLRGCVRAMRPHQWTKNALIFVPLVLGLEFFQFSLFVAAALAFVSFSAMASAIYIINDLLDLDSDRRHKNKRRRPFASGTVPIPTGLALSGGLFLFSCAVALFLPPAFWLVLATYLVITTAYSVALKRMLLIDVLTLAALYTTRIMAGAAAVTADDSFWLLAFSIFFFLSLALVKRYTELVEFGVGAERSKTGRGYVDADLETLAQAGMSSGFASVLVLALYVDSADVRQLYDHPYLLWPLCPLVLYIIVRIWILARRNQMHEDPVVFILRDWRSQIMVAAGALMFVAAAYVG
jgi:4-hydroxybenzoate polyprenyltransferase